MRFRTIGATSIAACTLAVAALSAAPAARADVGDVDVTFYNSAGLIIGTDQDVFANLTTAQCDTNPAPSGTTSATIVNLTDETVEVSTESCSDWVVSIPPLGRHTFPGNEADIFVDAPPGP